VAYEGRRVTTAGIDELTRVTMTTSILRRDNNLEGTY
jgi:hypothetical protein